MNDEFDHDPPPGKPMRAGTQPNALKIERDDWIPFGPDAEQGDQEDTEPDAIVLQALKRAGVLKKSIDRATNKSEWISEIRTGKDVKNYLRIGGWQQLASLYGYTVGSVVVEDHRDSGDRLIWSRARATLRNEAGVVIGTADAVCGRDEPKWQADPSFSIASMAQTRALSKAIRNVLGWVALLGGFGDTPGEEMEHLNVKDAKANSVSSPPTRTAVSGPAPSIFEDDDDEEAPICPAHGLPRNMVPAGRAKSTNKPFGDFWGSCDGHEEGEYCPKHYPKSSR